jgi:uncharacterized sodium:solute symporter family permease YidK
VRFGLGIFLLVVGGVLAFAVRDSIDAVDLTVVGYVCLAAGVLAIVLGAVQGAQRQRRVDRVEYVEDRRGDLPPPRR